MKRDIFIWLGPVLALGVAMLLRVLGLEFAPAVTAGIATLTVIWWISEAVPIGAASLVPFALLPMFGIVPHKQIATALGSHVIILLMGAFMLAKGLEKSGAHKRLAVYMVRLIGTKSAFRLVFGFMLASGFLSMWISNTATTLIMMPIALAVLAAVDNPRLKSALVLGIAYAASVGGMGTPIGTPPNVIFLGLYEELTGRSISFMGWMRIGVPVVVLALPLIALWLTRGVRLQGRIVLPDPGRWRRAEVRTLAVFGLTALAWMTRKDPYGGWSGLLHMPGVGDSTIALAGVLLMFVVPNGRLTQDGRRERLLDWETAGSIPWGLLLLFAGGIAMARGFTASGLSDMLGQWLGSLAGLPPLAIVLIICLVVTYLTEVTSNTATATLLMPILGAAAMATGLPPELLMIPATLAASSAFMLPVATAPNAIAYGLGGISIGEMVREGAVLSLLISTLIALVCYALLQASA